MGQGGWPGRQTCSRLGFGAILAVIFVLCDCCIAKCSTDWWGIGFWVCLVLPKRLAKAAEPPTFGKGSDGPNGTSIGPFPRGNPRCRDTWLFVQVVIGDATRMVTQSSSMHSFILCKVVF